MEIKAVHDSTMIYNVSKTLNNFNEYSLLKQRIDVQHWWDTFYFVTKLFGSDRLGTIDTIPKFLKYDQNQFFQQVMVTVFHY